MKLSEKMILGSTLIKHVPHMSHGPGEGCAIECAGASGSFDSHWINSAYASCPETGCAFHSIRSTVGGTIVHLNDDHKWSIDRIAQWVASVEPPEPPEPTFRSGLEELNAALSHLGDTIPATQPAEERAREERALRG